MKQINEKTKQMFDIIKFMYKKKDFVSAYDEEILEITQKSIKRTGDLLEEISSYFQEAVEKKTINKRFYYKLLQSEDVIFKILINSEDISWIINDVLINANKDIIKQLDEYTKKRVKKIAKDNENIFLFKNSIMETPSNMENFKRLKFAIKEREYRNIDYFDGFYENVKPLKLVFMDNNWYLAGIYDEKLRFFRISFINEVKYSDKNNFFIKNIDKYMKFLEKDLQNSLTLFGVEKKESIIKASVKVAKYFDKDMKKFLPSQKFIRKNSDGSVEFSLQYTQSLEILPFIKRWLPDLEIISPAELKNEFKEDLKKALESMQGDKI
jgi:predicted DNA-binding transcriptional regulator YafY